MVTVVWVEMTEGAANVLVEMPLVGPRPTAEKPEHTLGVAGTEVQVHVTPRLEPEGAVTSACKLEDWFPSRLLLETLSVTMTCCCAFAVPAAKQSSAGAQNERVL